MSDSTTPAKAVQISAIYAGLPCNCPICDKILKGLTTSYDNPYYATLGLAKDVFQQQCNAHGPLLQEMRDHCDKNRHPQDPVLQTMKLCLSKHPKQNGLNIWAQCDRTVGIPIRARYLFELVKRDQVEGHAGRVRLSNPQWLDDSLPTLWLDHCTACHSDACERPLLDHCVVDFRPAWLLDIVSDCIVPTAADLEYVALSYRWGHVGGLELRTGNLSQLRTPGSLTDLKERIPQTILDAISVTQLLNARYFWVDALCIPQDENDMKMHEISHMAAIYYNAKFVIVAADGENANHGLAGLKHISRRRQLDPMSMIPFGDVEHVIKPAFEELHSPKTEYFQRALTFQEFLFARRRLIFEKGMIRWECSVRAWQEDIVFSDDENARPKDSWMQIVKDGYPSLHSYGRLISEYNKRAATYPQDALPAIFGTLSTLGHTFDGGFLHGLPEMYFDTVLCWTSWRGRIERRVSSDSLSARGNLNCLPSWSWTGWRGSVDTYCYFTDDDFQKSGCIVASRRRYTVPITEWFTAESPSSTARRRIRSDFLHKRQIYKNLNRPLDREWERHEWDVRHSPQKPELRSIDYGFECPPPADMDGSCYFTHPRMKNYQFWYPIPIPSPTSRPVSHPQTPFLFCNTQKARLWGKPSQDKVNDVDDWSDRILASLQDEAGNWAGVVLQQTQNDFVVIDLNLPSLIPFDLVAISRGHIPISEMKHFMVEIQCSGFEETGSLYEFYNVLWVEWKSGVAYRKALGRVRRCMWEQQKLEDIDLVLG